MYLGLPESDHSDIRNLDLFRGIDEESFRSLMRGAYVQTFPPHTELITEGDPADFLHIVASGTVELFSKWEGRESLIDILEPFETFILAASVRDQPYLMSARALTKSRIIMIPSHDVREVFQSDSAFALLILEDLAESYREAIRNAKNIKLRTSVERLANYVLKNQHRDGPGGAFTLPVEKKKLASFLGMTPENLSRAFSALKNHGIDVSGQVITITDADALAVYAKPNSLIDV